MISMAPLAAFNILLVEYQFQHHFAYLLRTLPRFAVLLVCLGSMITLYTSFAYYFIEPGSTEFVTYFPDFGTGLWNMLMVFDASNWPSPMIPAFHQNRLYCFYFYFYIIAFNWGLLNLLLGFVYLFVRIEQDSISSRFTIIRRLYLNTAFQVLDVIGKGFLTYNQVDALIEEVYKYYMQTLRPPTSEERYELLLELDTSGSGVITRRDFEMIEEKCFQTSLKALRAKKIRFHRFFSTAASDASRKNTFHDDPSPRTFSTSNILRLVMQDHFTTRTQSQSESKGVVRESASDIPPLSESGGGNPSNPSLTEFVGEDASHIGAYYKGQRTERLLSEASNYGKISNQNLVNHLRSVEIMDRLAANQNNGDAGSKNTCYSALQQCYRYSRFKLKTFAMYVDSITFDISLDVFLALFAILCFATGDDYSWQLFIFYLVVASVECLCKFIVKGRFRYIKSSRNFFDGAITITLVGIVLGQEIEGNSQSFNNNFGLQSLVLLRLLFLPRNIIVLKSFDQFRRRHRAALVYAFQSAGHILFLSVTMIAMIYAFAALGGQIFGGSIVKTGENGAKISASEYGEGSYWPLNFNDMLSGIVTIFVLLHVNNMHVTTSGFVASTTRWAELFFALWYALGVLLMLNVLVAVFVNRFAGYLEILAIEQRKQQLEQRALDGEKVVEVSLPRNSSGNNLTNAMSLANDRSSLTNRRNIPRSSAAGEVITNSDSILRRASSLNGARGSFLDELHGGGFEDSIFADNSYRASLLQMMKSMTMRTSFSRPSAMSRQSESFSVGPRKSQVPNQARATMTSNQALSRNLLRKTLSESAMPIPRPSTARYPWETSESSHQKSMLFVAHRRTQGDRSGFEHEDPDADLEVSPDAIEDIVVNVELKLHNLEDGTLNDANEESVKKAMQTIEKDLGRGDPPPSKPIRLTTFFKSAPPADNSAQSSLNSALWAHSVPPLSEASSKAPQSASQAGSFFYLFRCLCRKIGLPGDYESEQELTRFEKAAVLIQFAREGEGEQVIHYSRFSFHCYKLHNRYVRLFRFSALLLMILRFFERPMWTYRVPDSDPGWWHNEVYPRFGIPLISAQLTTAFKMPLFLILLIGLGLELGYKEDSPNNFLSAVKQRIISVINRNEEETIPLSGRISRSRIFRVLLTLHAILMILILFVEIITNFSNPALVTVTSFGSVLYFLWFNRRTLQKARIIGQILPKFLLIVLLLAILILIFAGFGPLIFDLENHKDDDYNNATNTNDDDGTIYFNNFPNAIWSVFVAITSSSYPNQVLPSYHTYRETCIYFISFITLGSFGLLNVIIVLVFIEFQKSLQQSYDKQKIFRDILLFKAFHVLDVDSKGFLYYDEIQEVCDEMYINYSNFQKIGFNKSLTRKLLIEILDIDGDNKINLKDFLFFLDVMRIKLKLYKKYDLLQHYRHYLAQKQLQQQQQGLSPSLATASSLTGGEGIGGGSTKSATTAMNNKEKEESWSMRFTHILFRYIPMKWLLWIDQRLVATRNLDLIADSLGLLFFLLNIFINGIHNLYNPTRSFVLLIILTLFVYSIEMIIKIVFRGLSDYFRSYRNRFDFCMTLILFFGIIIDSSIKLLYSNDFFTFICKIVYLLRIFFYPRNIRLLLSNHRDINKIAKLLRKILSKLYTLTMVFFCVAYSYANIGCYLYGGVINKQSSNTHFLNSQYVENDFWSINFNDMMSSLSTLFICLHVSDFDVVTTGFTTTTSDWSRLYFAFWYIIGVLFLLNVLKSFFLGEFLSLFINPTDNLPGLGYNNEKNDGNGGKKKRNSKKEKSNKKRRSRRRSSQGNGEGTIEESEGEKAEEEEERGSDFTSLMSKRDTHWISRQRLMNEGLRNRLIDRLNRSLVESNRQELGEEDLNNTSQKIDDEDSMKSESIDQNDDEDDDTNVKTIKPGQLSYSEYKSTHETRPPRKSLPLMTTTSSISSTSNPLHHASKAPSIAVPSSTPSTTDILVEQYQQQNPHRNSVSSSSSFFREIDENTATSTSDHHETQNPLHVATSEVDEELTSPYDGSTVIVSSLKSKVSEVPLI